MVLLESVSVPFGSAAPEFSLKGVDGKQYSLSDFAGAKVLCVIFMCNHCPYVQAIWDRFVKLQERFGEEVQLVGINPNLNPDYDEETFEKMQEYSERYKMNFPYLQDDTQEVARAYNAQCTPDIYVYDEKRELVYHGRIEEEELAGAIEAVLHGEKPSEEQNPSIGCSIKWRD